ncbi:MAG: hypothetical protein KDM64_15815, partial [Verrucomicrobiae bacterium]|nr:hypothetical protein [Verrucomicrobiae bacterium]
MKLSFRPVCGAAIGAVCLLSSFPVNAQDDAVPLVLDDTAPQSVSPSPVMGTLDTIVVTGKAENLLGVAPSASKGQSSAEELAERPFLRRGELLEVVPGMIITQHSGGGKANQ